MTGGIDMSLLEAFFWAIVIMFGITLLALFVIKGDCDVDGGDDWGDFGG